MSRIYFHSPSGEAELWGGERAWLGSLCNDVTTGILNIRRHDQVREALGKLIKQSWLGPPPEYQGQRDYHEAFSRWCSSAELALTAADDALTYEGHQLNQFSLILKTAARTGGNALKLAARIHGQCEIHCYCEGVDRWWMAGLIDEGLGSGVLRRLGQQWPDLAKNHCTWEDVTAFLRGRDDEPVVLSYSVCGQFPNQYAAQWEAPDGSEDAWYDLPFEERWDLGMRGLRESGGGLRINPAEWDTFSFGHGLSAFDLMVPDWEHRVRTALELGDKVAVPA